jgi:hypothetical protein
MAPSPKFWPGAAKKNGGWLKEHITPSGRVSGRSDGSARSVTFNNQNSVDTPIDFTQHDAKIRNRRASRINIAHLKQTFIGYGRIGYFNPFSFMALPFRWKGTVIPQLIILMVICFFSGVLANLIPAMAMAPETHEVLGFVLGKTHILHETNT